jgi:hypothetical protein
MNKRHRCLPHLLVQLRVAFLTAKRLRQRRSAVAAQARVRGGDAWEPKAMARVWEKDSGAAQHPL